VTQECAIGKVVDNVLLLTKDVTTENSLQPSTWKKPMIFRFSRARLSFLTNISSFINQEDCNLVASARIARN
jgi:hypothetical protein